MNSNKFEETKNKVIFSAERLAERYFLNKFGSAKFSKEPKIELEATEGITSDSYQFTGKIRCYASTPVLEGYSEVGLDLTVNNNDVSVESETTVGENIVKALNASEDYLPTEEVVTASLDSFRLIDTGEKYLKVAHPALEDAEIGVVGRNEYETSPNKAELLKSIVTDSIARTASYNYKLEFIGSFVEPKIEKKADDDDYCQECEKPLQFGGICEQCKRDLENDAEATQKTASLNPEPNKSWLTDTEPPMSGAEFMEYQCPVCKESFEDYDLGQHDKSCPGTPEVMQDKPAIQINENMPRAKMSGGVEQSMQAEQQKLAAEKDKISNTAVNQLIPTLQSLGFGSARVSEVTPNLSYSDSGFDGSVDVMAFVEDSSSTKLVSLPIKIHASQIELPKVNLIKELVQKAINLNERLTEQLTKEALLSLSSVDEKVEYEKNYVESILKEDNKIEKIATENGLSGVQLVGPQDSLVLQKHLLPIDAQDMKVGDVVFADNSYYQLVDTEGMQNDKNSQSSSLWKFVKCEPPKEDKNPAIRIPE